MSNTVEKVSQETKNDHYRIYESIWRNIDREDTLVNQRITWAVLLSGGLFAATALLANVAASPPTKITQPVQALFLALMIVLAIVGIIFSLRVREGVMAAQSQINYLKNEYARYLTPDCESLFERQYKLPRPFGDLRDYISGSQAAIIFPKLMLAVWILTSIVEFSFLVAVLAQLLIPPASV